MPACENALLTLQDGLRTATGEGEFLDVAGRFARDIGHRWFAYFSTDSRFDVLTNYPKEWQKCYLKNEYNKIDPVVKKAANAKDSFSWKAPDKTKCSIERGFFGQASDFQINSGIVVPLKGSLGRRSALTFSGDGKYQVDHADKEGMEILKTASIYFDSFYSCRMNEAESKKLILSTRERQCLMWISQGKLLPEVASIMNVSVTMVNTFVGNIKRKLKATTLAHAVKIAISVNEIELIRI